MNSTLSGRFCVGTARGGVVRHRTGSTAGLAPRTRNAVPSCSTSQGRCPSFCPAWIKSATGPAPNELQLPHQPAVRAVEPAEQPLADLHQVGVTDRVIVRLGLPGQVGDLARVERAAGELVRVVAPVAQLDLIRAEIGQRDGDDADGHGRAPGGSRGDRNRPHPHRSYPEVNGPVRCFSPNLAKIRGQQCANRFWRSAAVRRGA